MIQTVRFVVAIGIFACLLSVISGCASAGSQTSAGAPIADIPVALAKGQIRLTCGVGCSGSWGGARTKAKALYDNRLWDDLAVLVANVGFESDLPYFYLARSSEELGYTEAALTYYRLALSNVHRCAGFINNCDGFVFPRDVSAQISLIPGGESKKRVIAATNVQSQGSSSVVAPATSNQAPSTTPIISEQPPKTKAASRSAGVVVKYDEFKKLTNYQGSLLNFGSGTVLLRAWKLDAGELWIQIYVVDSYDGDWRFYSSAFDSDGKSLPVTVISRDVGSCSRYSGCSHSEHIGIKVNREYLERHQIDGTRFKLSGKGGEQIYSLPPSYIEEFLGALPPL